jgi:type II secretory pathway pseudopilin PulG
MRNWERNDGFSLLEILMIVGILATFLSLVVLSYQNSQRARKEEALKQRLAEIREAIDKYYLDHGHFPCSSSDFNRQGDPELFRQQLLWYTDRQGKPSRTRNRDFRYGPYLSNIPEEPFTGTAQVVIDTVHSYTLVELKKFVAEWPGATGGWYYQASTGFVVANLNSKRFGKHYAYY